MPNTVIIPFRKGSKEIPNKNIKEFNGIPLYKKVIDEISQISEEFVHRIIIATDYPSNDILPNLNSDYRHHFYNRQMMENTEDNATTESVILSWLDSTIISLHENISLHEKIILVQITNPFIRYQYIEEALKLKNNNRGSIFSGVKIDKYVYKNESEIDTVLPRQPRQINNKTNFVENGSFYIFNAYDFLRCKNRFIYPISYYYMPQHTIFELDKKEDWEFLEALEKSLEQ